MDAPVEPELPRAVAVAWGVATFPQRGPQRELSHERIVEAAVEIADAEGLEAVTMQRVAATFGFTTMALYRYISSKAELHRLMADAALDHDELVAIPTDDWRAGIREWAAVLRRRYLTHPWLLQLPLDRELLLMPNNVAMADVAMRALRPLGIGAQERLAVLVAASVLVRGFAALQAEMFAEPYGYPPGTREALAEVVTNARFPDIAPLVADGSYLGQSPDAEPPEADDLDLDLGLELLLDGVARLPERVGNAVPPPAAPLGPQEAYDQAQRAYAEAVATRKAAEKRVKQLAAVEGQRQRQRDAAKEVAKAADRAKRHQGA